jgi:hypothetical protein
MKYALVCKNELKVAGYRVAEIVDVIPFEPSPDHMWVECDDDLVADTKWFDPNDNSFKEIPIIIYKQNNLPEIKIGENQPSTSGTQAI